MKRRQPPLPRPAPAGFWEARLLPFFKQYSVGLTLALLAIASVRIVSTYQPLSLTFDEPGHFACGLEYLTNHVYRLESQHPPLARAAIALGPYLSGIRLDRGPLEFPGEPVRDSKGRTTFTKAASPNRAIALARLGTLPFFWLAGFAIYAWARRLFGCGVAVLATGLFSLTPPVLAHAGLATTDMGLSACLMAAFLALLVWAESPGWKSGVLLGICGAAAALTKFTALAFLPCAAVLALLCYLALRRPPIAELVTLGKARVASLALAAAVGAFAIWTCYWFSFGVVPQWAIRLPAPEFFDGIVMAARHNSFGHPAYLFGEKSLKGWWYFFPVMLSVKTPLACLLLLIPGVVVIAARRRDPRYWTPLAFALGILLPAMAGSVNIGVRHVLPVYAALAIVAALGLARLFQGPPGAVTWLGGLLVLWMAVSGSLYHPDYLCYFNELAPEQREQLAVDSDLDWGQDMRLAARFLRGVGATEVASNYPNFDLLPALNGLPLTKPITRAEPSKGWNLIGPTIAGHEDDLIHPTMTGTDFESLKKAQSAKLVWWQARVPDRRIGGVLLYYAE